nr:dihydroxy-acid dehydratase [Actinomycetota bacterium]
IGHVAPEAAHGGPIALVREGDRVVLDLTARTLDLIVDDDELAQRRAEWQPPEPTLRTGVLRKYAALVSSAAQGAVC